jgi:NTP pyrophosphatase (non-canonical NTP hydrolase)
VTITDLCTVVHKNAVDKGFWEGVDRADPNVIAAKLMLIVSEAAEALEALRETGTDSWTAAPCEGGALGKPMGFGPELADIVIRTCDLAEALKIDLPYWIDTVHARNLTRPFKHGGKAL